ncbi:MAG: hypothetical protein HYS34_03460 [Acidobacteria bacterium]|nr:hypothetical protein [Acidobacteriota bacterium]
MDGRAGHVEPRARGALIPRAVLAAVALAGGASGGIQAQEASGYAELAAGTSDAQAGDSTGRRTESESDTFLQRYGFDLNWRLYPNFTLLLGGLFERDAASAAGDSGTIDSTRRKMHPYLSALLRTAIFSGQFGYYRNEDDLKTDGISISDSQEIFNSTLGWRPKALPSLTFRFIRTNTIGADRRTQDTTDDLFDLVSEYRPADTIQLYYRGAIQDFEDRLQDISVRRVSQSGRATYGDSWWGQRIQFGAEYDVNHRESDVMASGIGEVLSPLFPIAGLSAITDTPLDGTLAPNPALIDDDRAASAGINLGLPPLGGDDRPRNIGLDLGAPSAVNTLLVWVDRQLPPAIAVTFSWDIYTSSDNLAWVPGQTGITAAMGTFETRFEIRFPDVAARYIKVVTRPLARTIPSADQYPDILVTELSAALRTPAAQADGRTSQTSELLTSSLRARLLDSPGVYYELAYFARQIGSLSTTSTLSNGVSLRHAFNPACSVAARVAREDSREAGGDRLSYLYTASLRAVPLQTLQHSLVFSGRWSDFEGRSSDSSSVYLYNTAELYRGVNANLGLGISQATAEDGQRTDGSQVNALATLVPHPTTTLNLLHQRNHNTRSGGSLAAEQRLDTRASQASVTYRPLGTLYLYFSYRMEHDDRAGDRFLRNYSLSWSPFPDGSLQVLLRFDEAYRSELESLSRIYSPRLRWNITDRWYAELAYEHSLVDSALEMTMRDAYTASMRIWF